MNIIKYLYLVILGFIIYNVFKGKYKTSKRNELVYDEDAVKIPEHLCTSLKSDDEDMAFEEMEAHCQVKYKTVKWDDIKTWEYTFVNHTNFNHTVYLRITTANETISVTDVHHLMRVKRYFKKYAGEKQIVNFTNKMELLGVILSCAIIIAFAYALFFRW